MDTKVMNEAANNIRVLIASMVEKAKSGHPGGAIGAADFINTLYTKFLVYDPNDPNWISRDRFFLDPGHMSPMLYSVLALSGKYTVDDLKAFRQWGSPTPGHPELCVARGVENSSGPLGQGHVMAVGCAIAERFFAARFGETFAHKTYAFISDGGIQEEISQGAGRMAGHLGLHNLIMFYDANDVQLSTRVDAVTSEDTAAKYRAWNWNVLEIDGSDCQAIAGALQTAIEEKQRPTLIIGHTIMAKGILAKDGSSMEGFVSTHGQPLSAAGADIEASIRNLGGDPADPFAIRPQVRALYEQRREELVRIAAERKAEQKAWAEANPELAKKLESYLRNELPHIDWDKIEVKPNVASRNASSAVLSALGEHVGNMIVSSADLANSDKTDGFLKKTRELTRSDFGGGFLQSGVAELTMACVMNGIVLHGGMRAACGTFFVFSDYMKPAIRMSALMELPVIFVYSHDAFRVGEDGPTHQPIEQEAQLRLLEMMNNLSGHMSMLVMRPADTAETIACWRLALENRHAPSALILSRQTVEDLPGFERERRAAAEEGCRYGGYILSADRDPQVVLLANGSEVSLLWHVMDELRTKGVRVQLCSFPSVGLFMRQPDEYRRKVLPAGVPRYGVTAGLPVSLRPLTDGPEPHEVYGLERFGASAPYKVLDEKFGYTTANILQRVEAFLGR